ncbi:MAG TPA: glycoside hydrolase family 9 protein [Actinomycetota bacterium]|nr:glycoside hydrolase family 9 protein [Actinomycetota bacterium]
MRIRPSLSRRRRLAVVLGVALVMASLGATGSASGGVPAVHGAVRVDQVGYARNEAKRAFLLAEAASAGARFSVVDAAGKTVFAGRVGPRTGGWNARYRAVHPIDFSPLHRDGRYRVVVEGVIGATSPPFRVASSRALFQDLVGDTVRFFQAQRDGAHVPALLDRQPSHLADRRATVYDTPVFSGDGGDVPAAPLEPIGGPVDVEGGWFDAGDFVKFTHATAYSVAEMLVVRRGLARHHRGLAAETRHGLRWLDKMWDQRHRVLYVQVGIGTGSEEFGFVGDHDVWRLPEADDALVVQPGDEEYFIKYRPVFRAAPPGQRISPNLAGRVAAAFALGAQVEARHDRKRARALLSKAASVFAMAKTTQVGELVTAFPHAYYPEDSWQDDMEFGAVELALAARALHDRRGTAWLRAATHWARQYLRSDHRDALNLYDTSALAHTDLVRALRRSRPSGSEVTVPDLVGDLRRQLESGAGPARHEPFGSAVDVTQFDAATRTFGFAATAGLYRRLTGDRSYDAFGTQQRDWALGANAWGTTFVIGEGTVFPHCPQHQVANLAGSLTGGRDVLVGAVVNGPNGAENFEDIGIPDGAEACPVDGVNRFAAFDRPDARFLDDVRAWPSVEPAIDFTSTGMLAFALAAAR